MGGRRVVDWDLRRRGRLVACTDRLRGRRGGCLLGSSDGSAPDCGSMRSAESAGRSHRCTGAVDGAGARPARVGALGHTGRGAEEGWIQTLDRRGAFRRNRRPLRREFLRDPDGCSWGSRSHDRLAARGQAASGWEEGRGARRGGVPGLGRVGATGSPVGGRRSPSGATGRRSGVGGFGSRVDRARPSVGV